MGQLSPHCTHIGPLYPFATSVTPECLELAPPILEKLGRGQVSQGLVRPDGVACPLPAQQGPSSSFQISCAIGVGMVFFGVGAVGPLDRAVQLGPLDR